MLGVLLIHAGRTVSVSALTEWMWGQDADPARPPRSLQNYASTLRKVLNTMEKPCPLPMIGQGYRLEVDPLRVDLHQAKQRQQQAGRAARDGDHERARELFSDALNLLSEPPLLDLDTDRADAYRRHIQQRSVLPCHYGLLECLYALGYPELMLDTLDELQAEHELDIALGKWRIAALRATSSHRQADEYSLGLRRRFQEEALFEEADDLLAYANKLKPKGIPGPRTAGEHPPADRVVPTVLPSGHSELAGRESAIMELDACTDQGRRANLVVLTGTAGIGKTAVALHWARRVHERFPDGYLYLDLRGFSTQPHMDAGELIRRLLTLFGTSADLLGKEAQFDRLAGVLGGRRVLLVLDNVADPEQVSPVLDVGSEAMVLVVSRHRLASLTMSYGATELRLSALSAHTTRDWLQRVIGDRCDAEPTALVDLVDLCAGVPLAVSLVGRYAAVRPSTTLSEVVELLTDEHRVLDVGDHDQAQLSIRASFTLSYSKLAPGPQRLFRLLGLHPTSTVGVGPAAALAGSSRQATLPTIDALVDANLVDQATGELRLHDLLHEFAVGCAETDETDEQRHLATTRMLDWYLHTAINAEKVVTPHRPPVPALAETGAITPTEFASDHEALQWHADHHTTLVAVVRTAYAQGQHAHLWRLANSINEHQKRQGHFQDALDCLMRGLDSVRALRRDGQLGSDESVAEPGTLNNIGYTYVALRNHTAARAYFDAAYQLFRTSDSPWGLAVAVHNRGYQAFLSGDLDAAEPLFEQALEIEQEHGLDHTRAGTLRRQGALRHQRGDHRGARVLWDRALTLFDAADDPQGSGQVLSDFAGAHLETGNVARAVDFGEHALAYLIRGHDLASLAETCRVLGEAYRRTGDRRRATEYSRECIRICWRLGDHTTQARALDVLASTLEAAGNRDAAREGWEHAYRLYRDLGDDAQVAVLSRLENLAP